MMALESQHNFDFSLSTSNRRRKRTQAADEVWMDIENIAKIDIRLFGRSKHLRDLDTKPACVAYSDGGHTRLWMPHTREPVPQVFHVPPKRVYSFNAPYEFGTVRDVLHRLYPEFAVIPIENFSCVRARALALALPGKLENLAAALGLAHQKDVAGHRRMLAIQRAYQAGKEPAAEQLEDLGLHCITDTDALRDAEGHLPPLSDADQKAWVVNAKINEAGIPIDLDLVHAGQELAQKLVPEGDAELARLTNGEIVSTGQVKKLLPHVREQGYRGESLRKKVVAQQLAENDTIEPDARRALELRRDHGLASFRKFGKIIAYTDDDGRARDGHDFGKAATGRTAGSGIQFQNMQRPLIKITDDVIDIALSRSIKRLKRFAAKAGVSPLAVLGSLLRAAVCAEDGYELIVADYNQIEPRSLADIAGETSDALGTPTSYNSSLPPWVTATTWPVGAG
jgi:DNA polymerase